MESFGLWLERRQTDWREHAVPTKELGTHSGETRPWILPSAVWEVGLWPGIRAREANGLPEYLGRHRIQRHTGANNLKSSWVLCANLYFPFRASEAGRALLAGFLQHEVANEIQTVDAVELEFAETGELHPSRLLGEAGGSRGSGQTSPDLAFVVNGGRGLVLTESKLGEHSFYPCSARSKRGSDRRPANPDLSRCDNALAVVDNPALNCQQAAWGRKYWDRLRTVVDREAWAELPYCAAAHTGYQLFRQQALAEGLANCGKYSLVVSCVVFDERNEVLAESLRPLGLAAIADWARLFRGRARFTTFTHQRWVAWVRANHQGEWREWLSWIGKRYGYEES